MSGIAGIFNLDGAPVDQALLRRMGERMAHRGPDGMGYWSDGPVGLAHQMLCTTPESLREKQPLANENGSLVLTLDGRVDNREELRDALRSEGVNLRDDTDAELVLRTYECWGEDSPRRILGDFALVIWDARNRRLFCARDIMGVRPFNYYSDERTFLFASELRALFEWEKMPRKPNEGVLGEMLCGTVASETETVWSGVLRLPKMRWMSVERGRAPVSRRYWFPNLRAKIRYRTDREYAEHFFQVFQEAVRCRMRTHRPLGAHLSGGLDSSSVVATAEWLRKQGRVTVPSFETYSVVFPGTPYDEGVFIREVLQRWELQAHLVAGEVAGPDWYAGQIKRSYDFPYYPNTRSMFPFMARAQANGVRVILTGEGADEWFEGCCPEYQNLLSRREFNAALGIFRARAGSAGFSTALSEVALQTFWPYVPNNIRFWLKKALDREKGLPRWITPEFAGRTQLARRTRLVVSASRLSWGRSKLARVFDRTWDAHQKEMVERAHASFGLEYRSPYYDRRIIDFAFALPEGQRRREERTKYVIRQAMAEHLPAAVLNRDKTNEISNFDHTFKKTAELAYGSGVATGSALAGAGWVNQDEVLAQCHRLIDSNDDGDVSVWEPCMILWIDLWWKAFRDGAFSLDKTCSL